MPHDPQQRTRRRLEAAQGYLLLDMTEQALAELDAIIDPGLQKFDWNLLRGEVLRAKGEYPAAIPYFERALSLKPGHLDALMGAAWCYKRSDRLSDSIAAMQQAYQSHPEVSIVLYNLSCYYALAGNKDQALSWLGRALRMQPDLKQLIAAESDFHLLRGDADFCQLIELAGGAKK